MYVLTLVGLAIYAATTWIVVDNAGGVGIHSDDSNTPNGVVLWTACRSSERSDRTVVITGGNSGIGLEAAKALRADGANVVLACRDLARARKAAPGMTVRELDLTDLDSVAAFADGHRPSVDALICNAGIMGGHFQVTDQGLERQMGTNHLGHAALVARLFPLLEQASGRVVTISSIAARGGKPRTRR